MSIDNIIGQIPRGVSTRRHVVEFCNHFAFVSKIEHQSVCQSLKDELWTTAMQEELNQFVRNEIWTLVPRTNQMNVIGTKWLFRNKSDD